MLFACTESQHGYADGEVGEVVELLDREDSHQEHFVGERAPGERENREWPGDPTHGISAGL
jgi:hypothetical protein